MFHNLKGYDSHLIFYELHKFNLKVDVRPNGLEEYMAFFLGKNLLLTVCNLWILVLTSLLKI